MERRECTTHYELLAFEQRLASHGATGDARHLSLSFLVMSLVGLLRGVD